MKKYIFSCLLIFVLFLMSSCAGQKKSETMPGIDIPLAEYNTKIVITLWPGTPNSFQNGDSTDLVLNNQSGNTIIFPQDYGIKVFEKQTQGWIPIENNYGYPEGENTLQTSTINPGGLAFGAAPSDPNLKSPATVRVVVIGHLQDKPDEAVGAFIDVEINP
jgi:hypothetical protein